MNKKSNYHYKVAYLGIAGSFSFVAAKKYFNKDMKLISCTNINDVFKKVAVNNCDFGIVPLENSTTGSIGETYDLFLSHKLSIIGEIILKIHHHILTKQKMAHLKEIKYCYVQPQTFSQCKNFFTLNPWIKPVFCDDNATAAKLLSKDNNLKSIAISTKMAAKLYKLFILKNKIEDNKTNFTRFAVIAQKSESVGNKVSIVFSVKHEPGSLFKALTPYKKYGLNLTKIESRPVFGKPWEYIFILDLETGNNIFLNKALKGMEKETDFIRILGKYEKGEIYEA